jgi:hypothetical protein|tara:strand:+ start:399561 stop:400088 length:528 start_codon:yes stop_codon:yes gene_type:complete
MNYKIGELVEGEGVYMGTAAVLSNLGITEKFNVFSTPDNFYISNDVPMFEFEDAVDFVANLQGFFNHDGVRISSEEGLAKAVSDGTYEGQWVLPNYKTMKNVIAANKDQGSFKESVIKSAFNSFSGPEYAWVLRDGEDMPEAANSFCLDTERFLTKTIGDEAEASIRPIRLVPAL